MLPYSDKYHLAACVDVATVTNASGPVAQWIRHRPTEPGIAGSSPAGVIFLALANTKAIRKAARISAVVLFRHLLNSNMVPRGLEPRTLRLLAVRSNQLSYETS